MAPGDHVGRDARVVEVDQVLLVDHQVPAARPVLQLLGLGQQLPVGAEEPVPGVPVALDQRMPDEQLAGQLRVDPSEVDGPTDDDRDAVQGDPLGGHGSRPLSRPMWLRVGATDQVLGQRLDPLRVDPGHGAGEQPGSLDQLGGHHPARWSPGQRRPRKDHELGAAGAEVLAPPAALTVAAADSGPELAVRRRQQADLAQQAGEHGHVDPVRVGVGVVRAQTGGAGGRPQLPVQVLPLPNAQVVQELLAQQPAEAAAGQRGALLFQVVPQVDEGQEVGAGGVQGATVGGQLAGEPGVLLVGGRTLLGGALPGVLHRQRRGDHQHLAQATGAVRLHEHAAQPRIHRQGGQRSPHLGQLPATGRVRRALVPEPQGAELLQQPQPVLHRARVGRLHEREGQQVTQLKGDHLQDHRGQVGTQDLRLGELRAGVEVVLGVEPDADAVGHPAAAPGPLVGAGLRDLLDGQPLDLEPSREAGDPRGSGVDDVADPGHGQRRLRHVGGQHHPASGMRGEHPVLLGGRQPGVERQDLGVPQVQPAQRVRGVPDLPLAGQEHQDVAVTLALQLTHGVADGVGLVAVRVVVGVVRVDDRPVPDLDRIAAPGDLDDRYLGSGGPGEVSREPLRVDGRGGDDHLEVGSAGQQLGQVAEDEVDVEAALVRLVDDQRVVLAEHPVAGQLGQQDAVGHQLDQGGRRRHGR